MSASRFCRNFLTFPQGASENGYHTTGEKEHRNNDPIIQKTRDFQTASRVNTKEQGHLDVPLVFVYFPESGKNHFNCRLRESTEQKKAKNIIISDHRLYTTLQKGDSADRGKRLNLNMGHRYNTEQKNTNCSSSDEAVGRVLRSSSRCATNDHGTSSSLRGHVESMVTLKLPPGSTLVSDRGVFQTKDKERAFACGYCGKNYKRKIHVSRHIMQKHEENYVLSHADCAGRDEGLSQSIGPRCNIEQKDTNCNSDEMASRVPRSPSCCATNDHGTLSSFCSNVESMITSQLPPGSTLVSDRGVFRIRNEEKPFACGYCDKNYKRKKHLYWHIKQKHHEKHVTNHTQDKPFTCDQCGMRFRLKSDLCRHKFMHSEERLFSCKICNKSYTSKRKLFRHSKLSKVHKKEECREGVICTICKKEFSDHYNLKEHMNTYTGGKPFKCSFCERHFPVDIYLQIHLLSHHENVKLLPGDTQEPEESILSVGLPVQVATNQGIKQFNEDNSQREQMINQESILASNKCNTLEEQLTYNTSLLQSNVHPFQVEDSQIQTKSILPTVPSGVATTDPDSALSCTNSRLVRAIKRSSENVYNKVVSASKVAIVGEPRTSNTMEAKPNQTQGKGYPTKVMNAKRISLASGIVFEDEVSSPDGSRCSTTAQTLLSSEKSETSEEVPAASSRQANNIHVTSSSGFRQVESTLTSKPPPGATLLNYRHVIYTKGKEKPYSCAHCGKAYTNRHSVRGHVIHSHKEKRYSCEFCGRSYGEQYCLKQHMRMHTKEKPYTCDQCGKSFRCLGGLRCHKFTHAAGRHFLCKVCNKSYKRKVHLNIHSQIHNREECRGVICNICKKRFLKPSGLKNHMTIHTGEKPFKCSLCDKQFRMKMQLQSHLNIHSGLRKTCSVCGKSVGVNSMYSHMRMHTGENQTGEKRFECNICGKRFPRKPNLEGHLRSHTGEKPFACGGCNKRFALYSNMMTHKAKCTRLSENLA